MKTMTCNQLGGACEEAFSGSTFEEIAEQSKQHGMAMFEKGDEAHLEAMRKMKSLSKEPGGFDKWYQGKIDLFNSLPEH